VEASGDFGNRFPLTYWFHSEGYRDSGRFTNSETKILRSEIILGYKPRYNHDLYLDAVYLGERDELPPEASRQVWGVDDNQTLKDRTYYVQLGYHHRFSPASHLLTAFRFYRNKDKIQNPDAEEDGAGFQEMRNQLRNTAFGARHLFTLFDHHQTSYGMDYNSLKLKGHGEWPLWPPLWTITTKASTNNESLIFYLYDRWTVYPKITLDGGLFLSSFRTETESHSEDTLFGSTDEGPTTKDNLRLNPRIGLTIDLGKGALRLGYQERSTPGFLGELSPVGVAGLIPPTFDISFSQAKDMQGSVEVELWEKTFAKALLGYESLSDLGSRQKAQIVYGRLALNQILSRHFAFSAGYNYNETQYRDGSDRELRGVPRHSGDARWVFVHPWEITSTLTESYIGERFADTANQIKLNGFFLTDLSVSKEFMQKRVRLAFAVTNLFDKEYETLDHPYWWYDGAFRGKGRAFSFRGEYRF
jgi:outer membrane receptor protein involved in Fe transport